MRFKIQSCHFCGFFHYEIVPLFKEVQSICVTLIEKLLENELPLLVTTVNVIGLFVARPMSTYTVNNKIIKILMLKKHYVRTKILVVFKTILISISFFKLPFFDFWSVDADMSLAESKQVENSEKLKFYNF